MVLGRGGTGGAALGKPALDVSLAVWRYAGHRAWRDGETGGGTGSHGRAKATEAVRRAIRAGQASVGALAHRTDNGTGRNLMRRPRRGHPFVDRTPTNGEAAADAIRATQEGPRIRRRHARDVARETHGIEHRAAAPRTNGPVERTNRTPKDATVRRYHHGACDELRQRLRLLDARNHARVTERGREHRAMVRPGRCAPPVAPWRARPRAPPSAAASPPPPVPRGSRSRSWRSPPRSGW